MKFNRFNLYQESDEIESVQSDQFDDSSDNIDVSEEDPIQENDFDFNFDDLYMESDDDKKDSDEEKDNDNDDEDDDLDTTIDEIEKSSKKHDNDDFDLSSFGTDDSDVQNEYDKDEIDLLNNLIAAENDAMNDYFEAGKNTNMEVLRRLYADIGSEERFHVEQLIYAKCTITGEQYKPRDPKVKKEYEELLAMGMDEDTAASTAIDKSSINGTDNGDDSEMEELEQETAVIETMLIQNEILSHICEHFSYNKIDDAMTVFIEAYVQESLDNYASLPSEVKKLQSPLKLALKGLKASVNGILRLSNIIKDTIIKNKQRTWRKMQWIKKNGIAGLFKNGIYLYFYNDKNSNYDTETPAVYVDFLYRLSKNIGENCGIRLSQAAQHKTISNPIRFSSISDGLNQLRQVVLSKTKVVVTDKNQEMLAKEFFGYSDEKVAVAVKRNDNDPAVYESDNIYNRLQLLTTLTKAYSDISVEILEQLEKFEGDVNSIYYKNRSLYNKAVDAMKIITNKYNEFIKGMAHDLKVIISLDNGILQMTRDHDMANQTGKKYDGPDVRTSNGSRVNNNTNNQTTVTTPKKLPHKW